MTAEPAMRVSAPWLQLREGADSAARSRALASYAARYVAGRAAAGHEPSVVYDLGSGTGAMARWLAPMLPGPQHWVLLDHDEDLLSAAATAYRRPGADGAPVTIETRPIDLTELEPEDLSGATMVTASALVDLLTAPELDRLVATVMALACPALVTLSVVGRVRLRPYDPLDPVVAEAFDLHQRRTVGGRTLLGPDAVGHLATAFAQAGARVVSRPSPWRLAATDSMLAAEWFSGWVAAACEHRPEIAAEAARYRERRLAQIADGRLRATVHHSDLWVVPHG
jgi:hypothetical protein